jgi:hypothetical protein
MFSFLLTDLNQLQAVLTSPIALILLAFQIWMLVDAVRRQEWIWAIFIFFFSVLSAVIYYFLVYRQAAPAGGIGSGTRGFELPGAQDRRRIKELEAQIHHLDKAHHYLELGDIHFEQGKLDKALQAYGSAAERDPDDPDIQSHLGQCLLRLQRPAEARPLLEKVCAQAPKHEYGHSMMALAETYQALGERDQAIAAWQRVLQDNAYARARVQLAELYLAKDQPEPAAAELREVLTDDAHAPQFQRKRDAVWVKRAKRLLSQVAP